MKKLTALVLSVLFVLGLTACGNKVENTTGKAAETTANEPKTVTITSLNASKEKVELEVPYNPQRIAILDLAALDIIDNLGKGDRVVGTADTTIDYLKSYAENKSLKNLGNIKEADMEAVMQCEPDVIFIGGRLAASYDELSKIAPVVFLATDTDTGLVKSVSDNAKTIAKMFGMEAEVEKKVEGFNQRIAALSKIASGHTALVGMTTSGGFNLLGNTGRCSIIGKEIGFNNLTEDTQTTGNGAQAASGSAHGNEASFEVVAAKNPDYIFVMDRDSAIGTQGAKLAKEIMENELVKGSDAYKNGKIIYLEHPNVWYTAEGGITALDVMLKDLESQLK